MADILVVGAGPVGLTLALELARHGARCRIIDKRPAPLPYCRAIGVTPRTLEVWEAMGIARDMIDAGIWLAGLRSIVHGVPPNDSRPSLDDLPYSMLGLPQYETEAHLTRQLARRGIAIERGTVLACLAQDTEGVAVRLEAGDGSVAEEARFSYVVGCDGAHSTVRRSLGIAFEGEAFPMLFMLGDVQIGWDLPRGMALRALRPVENAAPDMFIAIPLPEPGRYRVSALAPDGLDAGGGSEHGLQAELPGPDLATLQEVADRLLPEPATLSDLRWSSLFRISMRLAARYGEGRVFLAGDAAHIHPPTGGQGMNTGIQDAYNLAWKLARVAGGTAPAALLDSYDAERRPVGADVVARTRAASENYGRERGGAPDRLADTQILISYRGTPWVSEDAPNASGPAAGDRAPDVQSLARHGFGFRLRLFDVLRGTEPVLLAHVAPGALEDFAALGRTLAPHVRTVALTATPPAAEPFGLSVYHDPDGAFAVAYGTEMAYLVRPDGHIGWRGPSWHAPGLAGYLGRVFGAEG
ncbi:MAG TPA: FAD-dependent monooxygenase [Xanthobacteraceae bacterium]|nr:FAD-dependent monooxygenase [Xanthobacteraceae bacterium]